MNVFLNDGLGVFVSLRHQCSRNSSFRMRISQEGHYLFLQTFFNGLISPAARGPIRAAAPARGLRTAFTPETGEP